MTLPQRLALLASLLPMVGISISFGLTAVSDPAARCIPWIDGCTTITATGVCYPAAYYLRGFLIATAIACLVWWYCASIWLQTRAQPLKRWMYTLIILSMIGSLMLVASIAVLGEHMLPPSEHRFLWRFHTLTAGLFFLLTSLCQMLMTFYCWRYRHKLDISSQRLWLKTLLALGQLGSLIAFYVLSQTDMDHGAVEAIGEWWLATFCCLYFITGYRDWRDFRLTQPEIVMAGGEA